jgi:hypothetical protein
MFKVNDTLPNPFELNDGRVESQWRTWIYAEETARLVIALHIHDASFSSIYHQEPLLRHSISRLPQCCSEDVMNMPSADQWRTVVQTSPGLTTSPFRSYGALAGTMASIHEARAVGFEAEDISRFRQKLVCWIEEQAKESLSLANDSLCRLILWHECFISLYANMDELERWTGRDGLKAAEKVDETVRSWAASLAAKCCVLHALFIQKQLEALPTSAEPAIHVPRALFFSGIVVYTYLRAKPSAQLPTISPSDMNIPEIQLSHRANGLSSNFGYSLPFRTLAVDYGMVYSAMDRLHRLGHSDVSRKFASTLEALFEDSEVRL